MIYLRAIADTLSHLASKQLARGAKRKPTGPGGPTEGNRARNGHEAGNALPEDHLETDDHALDLGRNCESGRRESNPHDQLGRRSAHGRRGPWSADSCSR
jgi:hypothetical protein